MMQYKVELSTKFKKDFKIIRKRGYDISLLKNVVDTLSK